MRNMLRLTSSLPKTMSNMVPLMLALNACMLACMAPLARSDDFRVESKVFDGKNKQPSSENVTLFRAGVVYDYLADPPQVAVFDNAKNRFILLDTERKLRTELKTAEVLAFSGQLQAQAAKSSSEIIKFLAEPKFESTFDAESGQLVLTSSLLSYRVSTAKPKIAEFANQYREFSDWYARLNAITSPGSTPPFARLALNAELATRGLTPTQVQLTVRDKAPYAWRGLSLSSEHQFAWKLLPRDLERIDETGRQMASFKVVKFADFRVKDVARR
jgi:hypothetical protein